MVLLCAAAEADDDDDAEVRGFNGSVRDSILARRERCFGHRGAYVSYWDV